MVQKCASAHDRVNVSCGKQCCRVETKQIDSGRGLEASHCTFNYTAFLPLLQLISNPKLVVSSTMLDQEHMSHRRLAQY